MSHSSGLQFVSKSLSIEFLRFCRLVGYMKVLVVLMSFFLSVASAQDCRDFYSAGDNLVEQGRFEAFKRFILESSDDVAQVCRAKGVSCSNALARSSKKAADVGGFVASVMARIVYIAASNPFSTAFFSLEASKIKKDIFVPLAESIRQSKDAETALLRIEKNVIDPQSLVPESRLSRLTGGWLGKNKLTNEQIVDGLREKFLDSEIEFWARTKYSVGLLVWAGMKLPGQYALDVGTALVFTKGGSNVAYNAVKKVVLKRFTDSFEENRNLSMALRLRESIVDAFRFEAKGEVLEARDMIYEEFGFKDLIDQLERNPEVESLSRPELLDS